MDKLTELVEVEAIKLLKHRYIRCLDQKLWDELGDCFVPDATASYGGGAWSYEGREAILGFIRESMGSPQFLSSHRVGQPEIDLTGPDTARGTWALDDLVVHLELGVDIRGAAFYEDTYVKVDGAWRIRSTGYKRTFEEVRPRPADAQLTASWWDTGGRSTLAG